MCATLSSCSSFPLRPLLSFVVWCALFPIFFPVPLQSSSSMSSSSSSDGSLQENVYAKGSKFHSFKKIASEMGAIGPASKGFLQLASFHSVSKGFLGEYVSALPCCNCTFLARSFARSCRVSLESPLYLLALLWQLCGPGAVVEVATLSWLASQQT
jgi:hypothetical protein